MVYEAFIEEYTGEERLADRIKLYAGNVYSAKHCIVKLTQARSYYFL